MHKVRLRALLFAVLAAAWLAAPAGAAAPGSTLWVGVPTGFGPFPAQDVNDSSAYSAAVDRPEHLGASADGRFVAFASQSDGLSTEDDDRFTNIFVRDRVAQTTILVSRASGAGGAGADGTSSDPTISDDGRFVAFSSAAANLAPDDTDGAEDVFVRDLQTATTTLLSATTGGLGAASNGASTEPVISGDGSAVAFTTTATNLDGSGGPDPDTGADVYRRTLAGAMTLVSRASGAAGAKGDAASYEPAISDNGDVVAFASDATNLDPADTSPDTQVFRRVISTTTTTLVSRQSAADGGAVADGFSEAPAISGNGDAIAFRSGATNLDGPGGPDSSSGTDIYLRRAGAAITTLVSRADGAAGAALNQGGPPAIDDAGTRVAFAAESALVFPPVAGFDTYLVAERVLASGTTTVLSTGPGGPVGINAYRTAYVGAGTAVVFGAGSAPGLSSDQDGLVSHVFFRQPPGDPELISRPDGTGPVSAAMQSSRSGGEEGLRQLSADGRYVVFVTTSPAVLGKSAAIEQSIVRRDLLTGQTILVSRASGASGAPADSFSIQPSISADGNRVAFRSPATNLDPADTDAVNDTFVRDIAAATTSLVSRADGPAGASGDGASLGVRIAPGGRHVVFTSSSTNLVAGDLNGRTDAFVRDLDSGTTTLVSRADGAGGALGNGSVETADISADGRLVVFETTSTNLGDGDADFESDVYLRDLAANTTRLLSRADGAGPKGTARSPVISADGRVVTFQSSAASLGVPVGVPPQVFVRDIAAATTRLVSATAAGGLGDGTSLPGGLNDDGSLISFTSAAPNLGVPAGRELILLRRMAAAGTEIVSRADGAAGEPAHAIAQGPSISGDGNCVVYSGRGAPVPLPGISPDFEQVFLRVVSGECPKSPPPVAGPGPSATTTVVATPVIQSFTFTPARFRVGPKATAISAAAKRRPATGTTIGVRVSEPGRLRIAFDRRLKGRRVGKSCRKPTRRLRTRKACTRKARAGTLSRRLAGTTLKLRFSGRLGRKALAAGTYTATATLIGATGKTAKPRTRTITVRR